MRKQVMGIRELRQEASKLGIKNYAKLNKADLEAAVNSASGPKVSDNAEPIGQVAGRVVLVSKSDSDQTIGELLGSFSKGEARQVRKLMRTAGLNRFSALPRIVVGNRVAKAA
jgi:hypothetical protein